MMFRSGDKFPNDPLEVVIMVMALCVITVSGAFLYYLANQAV